MGAPRVLNEADANQIPLDGHGGRKTLFVAHIGVMVAHGCAVSLPASGSAQLGELAGCYRRYSHLRLHVLIAGERLVVNVQQTCRLYPAEDVQVRGQKRRRLPRGVRLLATGARLADTPLVLSTSCLTSCPADAASAPSRSSMAQLDFLLVR